MTEPRPHLTPNRVSLEATDQRLLLLSQVLAEKTPLRQVLTRLTNAIAAAFDVPVALVSLVDVESQHFLAQRGMPDWAADGTPISHSFCRQVVETEEALIIESSPDDARVAGNPAIADLGVAAYAGQPIRVNEIVLGSLCAISHMPRVWSEHELRALRDFAELAGFMIDSRLTSQTKLNVERAEVHAQAKERSAQIDRYQARAAEQTEAQALSRRFQASFLQRPMSPRGLDVDVYYQAGSDRMLLGGDFAGTLVDDDGVLHFIVGDVTGHGPEAAALAISLRSSWSALTGVGVELPRIVQELDRQTVSSDLFATVLLGCVRDGRLTLLSAGHHSPILVTSGRTEEPRFAPGPMLGLGFSPGIWTTGEVALGTQTILAFTDGLFEGFVNGTRERFGLERLHDLIARSGTDPGSLYQHVVMSNGAPLSDDVAILRIRPELT